MDQVILVKYTYEGKCHRDWHLSEYTENLSDSPFLSKS